MKVSTKCHCNPLRHIQTFPSLKMPNFNDHMALIIRTNTARCNQVYFCLLKLVSRHQELHFHSLLWNKVKWSLRYLCLSLVSADPDGVGSGRLLSQTQTEAQTGASHQPDVWKQLRGGEGRMDWWTDRWMGGMGRRMEEGEARAFCFSELSNSQLNCSVLDRTDSHSSGPLAINLSVIYLSIDWLIDLKTDWLTGWLGPQLPPFGGFWGRKISFRTDLDSYTTWLQTGKESLWGQKTKQTFSMHLSVWIWI